MYQSRNITLEQLKADKYLNREGRKKHANNTYIVRDCFVKGNEYRLVYHLSTVATFYLDGSVKVDSCGWKTVTTKERINWAVNPIGFQVFSDRGIWYVGEVGEWKKGHVFADGMILQKGKAPVYPKGYKNNEKAQKTLRKEINAFAKLCADSLPVARPGPRDCWYCYLTISEGKDEGKTLGDVSGDSHLRDHMSKEESYVVPSLIYNALQEMGGSKASYWGAFVNPEGEDTSCFLDHAKHVVKSCVRRYMCRKLGISY